MASHWELFFTFDKFGFAYAFDFRDCASASTFAFGMRKKTNNQTLSTCQDNELLNGQIAFYINLK